MGLFEAQDSFEALSDPLEGSKIGYHNMAYTYWYERKLLSCTVKFVFRYCSVKSIFQMSLERHCRMEKFGALTLTYSGREAESHRSYLLLFRLPSNDWNELQ